MSWTDLLDAFHVHINRKVTLRNGCNPENRWSYAYIPGIYEVLSKSWEVVKWQTCSWIMWSYKYLVGNLWLSWIASWLSIIRIPTYPRYSWSLLYTDLWLYFQTLKHIWWISALHDMFIVIVCENISVYAMYVESVPIFWCIFGEF